MQLEVAVIIMAITLTITISIISAVTRAIRRLVLLIIIAGFLIIVRIKLFPTTPINPPATPLPTLPPQPLLNPQVQGPYQLSETKRVP